MRRAPALTLYLAALSTTPLLLSGCDVVDPYNDRFACTRNADCIEGFICSPRSPRICIREGELDEYDTDEPDAVGGDTQVADTLDPPDTAVSTRDTSVGGPPDWPPLDAVDGCPWADPAVDLDGDGIPSGDEDTDGDCVVDPWEFSPLEADTDGDGTPDGLEATVAVCVPGLFDTPPFVEGLGLTLALPVGWSVTEVDATWARIAGPAGQIHGWIALGDVAATDSLRAIHRADTALLGAVRTVSERRIETVPDGASDPRREGWVAERVRTAPEPAINAAPGAVRDSMVGALLGTAPTPNGDGDACPSHRVSRMTMLLDETTRVSIGLVGCTGEVVDDTAFVFDDLERAAIVARGSDVAAETARCTAIPVSLQEIDVVLAIDNTRSMAEFQAAVVDGVQQLLARLRATGHAWRLAVTTTEAWLLETETIDRDELLDAATGIRGRVWRSNEVEMLEQEIDALVAQDMGCAAVDDMGMPVGEADDNLCGDERESGIDSARFVIDAARALPDDAGFRADQSAFVIVVTDEEDQRFLDAMGEPLVGTPLDDAVSAAVADLEAANAVPFFIAANTADAGGLCPPLDATDGVVGAEPAVGAARVATPGGGFAELCTADLGPAFVRAVDGIVAAGAPAAQTLPARPIPSSILVTDRGFALRRSRTAGWDLADDGRTIILYGLEFTTEVAVGFRTFTD